MSSVMTRAPSGFAGEMNTPSPCEAAKRRPRVEAPAWKITGVRCGDGSVIAKPGTEKYLPSW
jgi:hypothetical protein